MTAGFLKPGFPLKSNLHVPSSSGLESETLVMFSWSINCSGKRILSWGSVVIGSAEFVNYWFFTTKTLHCALLTICLETLPRSMDAVFPRPLLPIAIRSKFSFLAVVSRVLAGLDP